MVAIWFSLKLKGKKVLAFIILIFCLCAGCVSQKQVLKYEELRGEDIYYARPFYKEADREQKYIAGILHGEIMKYNMAEQSIYKPLPYSIDSLMFIHYQSQERRDIKDLVPPDLIEKGLEFLLLIHEVSGKSTEPDTTTRFELDYPIVVPVPGVGIGIIDTEGELGKANRYDYVNCTVTLINVSNKTTVFSVSLYAKSDELEGKRANKPIDFVERILELIYQSDNQY